MKALHRHGVYKNEPFKKRYVWAMKIKEEMEKVRPSVDFTEGNASSHRNVG